MPPRGVKPGTKRARQYEHIKDSQLDRGSSEERAGEIAARTVNKERAQSGESRQRSRTSVQDLSPSRRGGERSGTNRPKGRTREQLYNDARQLDVDGRSKMNDMMIGPIRTRSSRRTAIRCYTGYGDEHSDSREGLWVAQHDALQTPSHRAERRATS